MSSFLTIWRRVMPGLEPGIHAVVCITLAWMAGTSPAMTAEGKPAFFCDIYEKGAELPASFTFIGNGDAGRYDIAIWTDGTCTCDNGPAADREYARKQKLSLLSGGTSFACRLDSQHDNEVGR